MCFSHLSPSTQSLLDLDDDDDQLQLPIDDMLREMLQLGQPVVTATPLQ
jgi:hypothetical protein